MRLPLLGLSPVSAAHGGGNARPAPQSSKAQAGIRYDGRLSVPVPPVAAGIGRDYPDSDALCFFAT